MTSKAFLITSVLAAGLCQVPAAAQDYWFQIAGTPPLPPAPPVPAAGAWFRPGSFLGVGTQEIDSERAKRLKLSEVRGVEIIAVEEDTPAAKAGLQVGDVVLEYNGQRVEGNDQFARLVRETPAGHFARLLVGRDGHEMKLAATIATRSPSQDEFMFAMPDIHIPNIHIPEIQIPSMITGWRSSHLGVEVEPLGSQLAAYFGAKQGVLVRSVTAGSPAEKGGLRAGDVIVSVDGNPIHTGSELSSSLHSSPARPPRLTILRDHHELAIQLAAPLEEGKSPREWGTRRRTVSATGSNPL